MAASAEPSRGASGEPAPSVFSERPVSRALDVPGAPSMPSVPDMSSERPVSGALSVPGVPDAPVARDASAEPPLSADWRAGVERHQLRALPRGRVVVSCTASSGAGGLGRHTEEILAALERAGQPGMRLGASSDEMAGSAPWPRRRARRVLDAALVPLTRLSPAWRLWKVGTRFDADAAARLPAADHLIAFNGTSLAQFRAARRARYQSLALVSATAHMRRVVTRHAESRRAYPLEPSWATRMLERNLREYAQADRIYVASRYIWESFLEEGLPESALAWFPLTPHPRYRPAPADARAAQPDTFDILYVGGLTVDKGVPLLVDAVRRLPFADLRLVLVGGWKTRGMRRFLEGARAEDPRIEISVGDPLPRLRAGRLYVHAAYCDGFAYAAAEALACGLPVIASADTGMKDLIDDAPCRGLVVPTGDLETLTEAIAAAYRGEILCGRAARHG